MIPHGAAPQTVRELYDAYRVRRLRNAAANTMHKFDVAIRQFERELGRQATLADLNDDTVGAVLAAWGKSHRSKHTSNGYGAKLMALWRFACRRGWLTEWPEGDWKLYAPKPVPRAWTQDDLGRLYAQLAKQTGFIGAVPAHAWWLALHSVLFDTGERVGAVLSLLWEDVDLAANSILIRGENRKGDADDKLYFLHAETTARLSAMREPKREKVFPLPITMGALLWRYKRILEGAGLDAGRKSKFHRMRKTVASHIAAAKGREQASEALDHKDPSVTAAYIDPSICPGVRPAEVLWRPGEPG